MLSNVPFPRWRVTQMWWCISVNHVVINSGCILRKVDQCLALFFVTAVDNHNTLTAADGKVSVAHLHPCLVQAGLGHCHSSVV